VKEVIIVAGDKQLDVGSIRACLGHLECTTVPCETAEEIVDLLDLFPLCSVRTLLVLIEPGILKDISEQLLERLSKCSLDVPFVLVGEGDSQVDLGDKFERICADRVKLVPDRNPVAKVIEKTRMAIVSI